MWVCVLGYYSAISKYKFETCLAKWIHLENILKWNKHTHVNITKQEFNKMITFLSSYSRNFENIISTSKVIFKTKKSTFVVKSFCSKTVQRGEASFHMLWRKRANHFYSEEHNARGWHVWGHPRLLRLMNKKWGEKW